MGHRNEVLKQLANFQQGNARGPEGGTTPTQGGNAQ
jgi:hypothetical protein